MCAFALVYVCGLGWCDWGDLVGVFVYICVIWRHVLVPVPLPWGHGHACFSAAAWHLPGGSFFGITCCRAPSQHAADKSLILRVPSFDFPFLDYKARRSLSLFSFKVAQDMQLLFICFG